MPFWAAQPHRTCAGWEENPKWDRPGPIPSVKCNKAEKSKQELKQKNCINQKNMPKTYWIWRQWLSSFLESNWCTCNHQDLITVSPAILPPVSHFPCRYFGAWSGPRNFSERISLKQLRTISVPIGKTLHSFAACCGWPPHWIIWAKIIQMKSLRNLENEFQTARIWGEPNARDLLLSCYPLPTVFGF